MANGEGKESTTMRVLLQKPVSDQKIYSFLLPPIYPANLTLNKLLNQSPAIYKAPAGPKHHNHQTKWT